MKQVRLSLPAPRPHHGGTRAGAGRPNGTGQRAHVRRQRLDSRHPVHVTIKLKQGLPSLRRKDVFRCLRLAVRTARRRGLHVVHFAILSNHVHLIMEPRDASVREWIQSLGISFAKRINALCKRHGAVFQDRYHLHVLKTRREVKNALAYVLTNESRHRGLGRQGIAWTPYSSAYAFERWERLLGRKPRMICGLRWNESSVASWLDEIVSPARTWLLRVGWTLA